MKTSTRIIATAFAIATLANTGAVLAQQGAGMGGRMNQGGAMAHGMGSGNGQGIHHGDGTHGRMQGADTAASRASDLTGMKAELKLTAAQEPAWQKFESLMRQQTEASQARRTAMQTQMRDPQTAAQVDRTALRESMRNVQQANQAARDAARRDLLAELTPEQRVLAERHFNAAGGHRMAKHASVR